MTFRKATALIVGAGLLVTLAGCFDGTQTSSSRPASPTVQSAAPTAAPVTPTARPLPAPQPTGEPQQVNPSPDPGVGVPSDWNDDELLGACKSAWSQSGGVTDWSAYSPEAAISGNGDSYTVTISPVAAGDERSCTIAGTPAEPQVRLG